jgi:outer membrane lipoprotein carrier protein
MRRLLLLGLLAPWPLGPLAPWPLAAQAPTAESVTNRAVAAFQRVTTLRADFVQTVHDPMLGDDETSRGEFMQQRPDKVSMRWREPRGDLIVVDGQTLWVYLPSSTPGQVVRSDVRGRSGQVPDPVAEFLDRPQERFTITYVKAEAVGSRAADVLQMVPKRPDQPYRRVQIWVDRADALPRRVEIEEASGAVRRIQFDRLRVNAAVPASAFTFTPPHGVRVVDATR